MEQYKSVFKKYELLNREAGAVPTKDPPRKENCVRLAGKEPRNARQARKYYFFVAASEADQLAWVDAIKAVNGKVHQTLASTQKKKREKRCLLGG